MKLPTTPEACQHISLWNTKIISRLVAASVQVLEANATENQFSDYMSATMRRYFCILNTTS